MMGCSNPHPHGQAWSLTEIPHIPSLELSSLTKYSLNSDIPPSDAPRGPKGRPCMLCEYAHFEVGAAQDEGRVVVKNEDWVALVPWWATWPFEIMRKHAAIFLSSKLMLKTDGLVVLPYKRHIPSLTHLSSSEKSSFASILSAITKRYDNLFSCSFAYSMGIHQRPVPAKDGVETAPEQDEENVAHLHLHFFPPLLRSASVRKFLVG